ncbi:MAG: sugar phosphate isomerase/epimerase [Lachnospiraceae bacterium]|nr:sugar phosphate isomerase/epimerase [Lachnospiraceae bacterium]
MYMNLNPRTMGMNKYSFEEVLGAAHKAGWQGIEVPAHAFGSLENAREQGKRLADMGMRFGLMMAPCDMFKVDDPTFEEALAQWARWLERAKAAGCDSAYNHLWPGSDDRDYSENFEWYHNRLKKIHHIMKENGIRYGLEYQGLPTINHTFRYPFICNLAGAMALADSVSHDIGFVFDCIHWHTSGGGNNDLYLFLNNIDRVVNLHLDDAFVGESTSDFIFKERAMPNETGVIDSTAIVRAFHEKGYDGPVIVEPMAPTTVRYENMDLNEAAKEAALCLARILKEGGVFIE